MYYSLSLTKSTCFMRACYSYWLAWIQIHGLFDLAYHPLYTSFEYLTISSSAGSSARLSKGIKPFPMLLHPEVVSLLTYHAIRADAIYSFKGKVATRRLTKAWVAEDTNIAKHVPMPTLWLLACSLMPKGLGYIARARTQNNWGNKLICSRPINVY